MRKKGHAEYDMAALLEEAIDCFPNGLCIMDSGLRPIFSNKIATKAFGAFFAAMENGASVLDANIQAVKCANPDLSAEQCRQLAWSITEDMRAGRVFTIKAADGRLFNACFYTMGEELHVGVYLDVTDLKRRKGELESLKAEAEAANQAKSAFLANMSHEIRTPLKAILGTAGLLGQDKLARKTREQVSVILQSGITLKALLDDVLDLSKIEAGRMKLTPADKSLRHALEWQYNRWSAKARAKGLTFRLHVGEGVPDVLRFDAMRFGQCISNLLSNAIKFTERGSVDISVSTQAVEVGTEISVAIADTGIGMPPEIAARLFTPFMQADNTLSRRFDGTGLGLAITRKLAQLMGGDVSLQSQLGRGSTITLKIVAGAATGPVSVQEPSETELLAEIDRMFEPSAPQDPASAQIRSDGERNGATGSAQPEPSEADLDDLFAAMDSPGAKPPLPTEEPSPDLAPASEPAANIGKLRPVIALVHDAAAGISTSFDEGPASGTEYDIAALMQGAIDRLPDGFAILDSELVPIMANQVSREGFKAFYQTLDSGETYRQASFASRRAACPYASEDECWRHVDALQAKLLSGRSVEVVSPEGKVQTIAFRPMSHGRYVAVSVDITEHLKRQKELEESRREAEEADQAKSAFLANMSHEIRTPLNGILGMAQVLVHARITPEQRERAHTILNSGLALKALLDDVLDLSKIDAGRLALSRVMINFHELLERSIGPWQQEAKENGIALEVDIDPSVPVYLRADPVRLSQCVTNLLSNAIKFTDAGKICIEAAAQQAAAALEISLSVADTGIGMSQDVQKQIFRPFTHAEDTGSRHLSGTGLGLTITRKLARLMGGDITVHSREGKGSTFALSFIADLAGHASAEMPPAKMAEFAKKPRTAPSPKGKHILLVDDHPLNRRVANLFLKPEGYRVTEAENGLEALKRLEEDSFDLILLDIHMPVLDGLKTLARIRSSSKPWKDIPIIALTADAMSGDRERYLAEGMDGYISKPVDQHTLLDEIGRLLNGERKAGAAA